MIFIYIFFILIFIIFVYRLFNNKEFYENNLLNIYGEPLKKCKTDKYGSWDKYGYCSERDGGVHQICFNVNNETSNFSNITNQGNWSKNRVGNNNCMCLGAWALYKAKNKGNNKELICESIPNISLSKNYIDNWNTWNGNELPDQIINGVDNLVKQCYTNKKSNYLKNIYDELRNNYKKKWNSVI